MSVPPHAQIKLGTAVSIVLKQDQRTGKQVQGQVAQVLTRGNHPRGVKVKLSDGRVGRVQRLVNSPSTTETSSDINNKKYYRKMDHNPWADSSVGHNNQQPTQQSQQPQRYSQQRYYGEQQQQQYQPPQQPYHGQQNQSPTNDFYNQSGYSQTQQQPDYNAWSSESGNPPLPDRHPAYQGQPNQPNQTIRRQDTDTLLESQPDRAEQVEHLQAYEASARQSQGDRDRAQLEKEFQDVDGSLIAALYSDTQDLSSTREMLQELNRQ